MKANSSTEKPKTEAREIKVRRIAMLFVSLIHLGLRSIGKIEGDVPA
jgi:hypothetical protein